MALFHSQTRSHMIIKNITSSYNIFWWLLLSPLTAIGPLYNFKRLRCLISEQKHKMRYFFYWNVEKTMMGFPLVFGFCYSSSSSSFGFFVGMCLDQGIVGFPQFYRPYPLKRTQRWPKGAPRKSAYFFAEYYHFKTTAMEETTLLSSTPLLEPKLWTASSNLNKKWTEFSG